MMVLNPQRITENDVILLQNEDCFLSWGYLKGKFHHYKMTICFIIKLLEGDTPPLQNEDWFFYAFIIRLLEGKTSILQNGDWKWLESMRLGFHMLPSEGQLTLLQNEIGFLHVVFRWANSLTTKWLSIFKGLSTTETLKTHKMQFPSSGYKMPGPSPFFHVNLSLERPWNGAQGFPFCSWNSNGDVYGFFPDVEDEAYGLFTDLYRMWGMKLTDCLQIFTGFGEGGLRIVYGFGPDLGKEACGLFMDLDRVWGRRLTDCLRIFAGWRGRGLRIAYGFLPDVGDEAYGLLTDFYRIRERRLADCLWIWTGFVAEGLRIVYGFFPDVEDEAYGLFTDFYRM